MGILVFEGADELDIVGPYRVFSAANEVRELTGGPEVSLHLVAEAIGSVQLAGGLVIVPTDTFGTCPPLDVLLVPGGSSDRALGRRTAQESEATVEFVRSSAASAQVFGSVCTGAFILAESGLLDGRRANTHWRFRDELTELMGARDAGFELVPERVVWDENLVSGGGVTSGIDVALSILEKTMGEKVRPVVERALEITTPTSQTFGI